MVLWGVIVNAAAIVCGSLGELLRIQERLEMFGGWLERKIGNRGKGNVATGFVTPMLVYCVGAMAILGALDSGLRLNHDVLYIKTILDGFSSVIFSSTLGVVVLFSAVPVFYEGAIALSSTVIASFISQEMLDAIIQKITAVGGI